MKNGYTNPVTLRANSEKQFRVHLMAQDSTETETRFFLKDMNQLYYHHIKSHCSRFNKAL